MEDVLKLSIWARDYLSMKIDIDKMVESAKGGNEIAKAALTLLSYPGGGVTESGYYNFSKSRASKALESGIEPPYSINYLKENNSVLDLFSEEPEMIVQHTIYINENYEKEIRGIDNES